jgi:hypothetical protein
MLAVNQAKWEKSIGHMLQDLGGVFVVPLVLAGNRFYRVACWLRDEWRWNATIRELNRLNDRYLDDIGIRRSNLDLRDKELVNRLRAGG